MEHLPAMSTEEYLLLSELIAKQLGIVFPEHRRDLLESRLRGRLQSLHLPRFLDYYLRLQADANGERSRLAELVTNNETYFFREPQQLEALFAALAGSVGRPLRLLSAGCSSGEEAYTLAIQARQNGHALGRGALEIDAFDVDASRIAMAESAEYRRSALRAVTLEQLDQYFEPRGGDLWSLRTAYRAGVRLRWGNILDLFTFPSQGPYDAVFCRNVLIYFSEAALRRAVECFARVLRPGGLLFLGVSESIIGLSTQFETVRLGRAIAYRRVAG